MSYIEQVARMIQVRAHAHRAATSEEHDELYVFYALLALTVGESVTRENVHDAWAAWACLRRPDHDDIRPFMDLSEEDQLQDEPFRQAIVEVAHEL